MPHFYLIKSLDYMYRLIHSRHFLYLDVLNVQSDMRNIQYLINKNVSSSFSLYLSVFTHKHIYVYTKFIYWIIKHIFSVFSLSISLWILYCVMSSQVVSINSKVTWFCALNKRVGLVLHCVILSIPFYDKSYWSS